MNMNQQAPARFGSLPRSAGVLLPGKRARLITEIFAGVTLAAQNNMDDLAAVDMTLAMLLGAMLMLEPGSPGALYAADIVDWFLELGE